MPSAKPALSVEPEYRSGLEKKVADQLAAEGIRFSYEGEWVPYLVPERQAKYLRDFQPTGTNIILEAKGRFGHDKSDANGARERQKLILVREQHPELDLRIVFQNARKPIYKGSKTTYAKWAEDHKFKWSDKGTVPPEWIEEIRQLQRSPK